MRTEMKNNNQPTNVVLAISSSSSSYARTVAAAMLEQQQLATILLLHALWSLPSFLAFFDSTSLSRRYPSHAKQLIAGN